MDAVVEELASREFSPPIPELRLRADGLRERVWRAKMKARTSPVSQEFSSQLRDRALKQYRRCLADQNAEGAADEALLDVRAEVAGPRSYRVVIARGGAAPDWDMAADTWVMHALEAMAGPIVSWEGVSRALWKLWPLPPTSMPPPSSKTSLRTLAWLIRLFGGTPLARRAAREDLPRTSYILEGVIPAGAQRGGSPEPPRAPRRHGATRVS
ncbi:hypothetical protein [Sorangium sp. So ce341]|uniref:hypothetical protein n=1 Tax=Sorangium sp. So ce341 TaxID=3133302 RepID=UPI003F5D7505